MDYDQFIKSVFEAGGFTAREQAETAASATLTTLARRIGSEQAAHLAAQLPMVLKEQVESAGRETERFSLEEFFERVRQEEGVADRAEAARHARAVAGVLSEAITRGELEDVFSQLPAEYGDLFTAKDV